MNFMILVKADKNSEAGRMPDEKLLTEMGAPRQRERQGDERSRDCQNDENKKDAVRFEAHGLWRLQGHG